jgi:glycerophosphoryl diester phosphodiesterase
VKPLRLAHRGDWRRFPENSLDAMRAALAVNGCDGLEFDVRFSADGVAVLLHDPTLDRVQGVPGEVSALTAETLASHGIPGLAEVLAAVGRQPFLDIELKAAPTNELIDVLDASRGTPAGSLYRVSISSFDGEILEWVAGRRPGWDRWLNTRDLDPATVTRAVSLGCSTVAAQWRSIDARGVERARAAGLGLVAWTVRRRASYQRLADLGVAAIITEAAALDG